MNAVIIINKKEHYNQNVNLRVKKLCILGPMILLFSTLFSPTFFFDFVRILSGNPYYEIISGVSERQRIRAFYTFSLHVSSFLRSATACLWFCSFQPYCMFNNKGNHTVTYNWRYTLKMRKSHPNVKIYNIYCKSLFSVL